MRNFPVASYARTLSPMERDRFAAAALRSCDPRAVIAAFERKRRPAR